ncbi:uncharacterized protein [Aristolochia californica]|uniref:uncharacterized protein isoform X2 n=1 Tax=Aristolochia californica TaxID=171875 RepID=UPI0035D81422
MVAAGIRIPVSGLLIKSLSSLSTLHPSPSFNTLLFRQRVPFIFPFSSSLTASGLSDGAHAVLKDEGDVLLKGVRDKSGDVKNILEMVLAFFIDFLTPPVLKEALATLDKLADVKAVAQGGFPEAERCRLLIGHAEDMDILPDAIAALSISGNFAFESCDHGDFLGAILGTGIAREKLGDILLQGDKGAQAIVVPELVTFLVSTLDKVGNVTVSCTEIPLLALDYESPRTNSFKTVEASLRVDALASAGFKISRSKLVDLISKGDVKINWVSVTKNGATLRTGDIVSVRGKGRLKIGEINTTKKGRYAVELIKYL